MIISIATLIIGTIVGYLGQRSRFCTISGIRDFYLIKDPYRLKGLVGIFIGAVAGFALVNFFTGNLQGFTNSGGWQAFPMLSEGLNVQPLTLIPMASVGAFGMAYFSVMAEGCPFRQHVIAGEGRISGLLYIVGLVVGVIFYNIVIVPFLQLLTILG